MQLSRFSTAELPAAVPVSFGYRVEGGVFVFYIHSAGEGHKMECLQNDPRAVLSAVGDNRIGPGRTGLPFDLVSTKVSLRRARLNS